MEFLIEAVGICAGMALFGLAAWFAAAQVRL